MTGPLGFLVEGDLLTASGDSVRASLRRSAALKTDLGVLYTKPWFSVPVGVINPSVVSSATMMCLAVEWAKSCMI